MKRFIYLFLIFSSALFAKEKPTLYVWSLGFCFSADVQPEFAPMSPKIGVVEDRIIYSPKHYIKNIQDGSIVWVYAKHLANFVSDVLPHINGKIILVSGGSDATFPTNYPEKREILNAINSPSILHLFMQNCAYSHPKVTQIPIGIDLHTAVHWPYKCGFESSISSKKQSIQLTSLLKTLRQTGLRPIKAICDFGFNDSMHGEYNRYLEFNDDRATIRKRLENFPFASHLEKSVPRDTLWKMKGQCAFDISPPGNGIDCHRTWESLLLGCIVIVKDSFLNPLLKDLPVVVIQSWDEITPENLAMWRIKYADALTNSKYREKLTIDFWLNKMRTIQNRYLTSKLEMDES